MRKNYFLGLLFGGILCVFFLTSCSKVSTPKPYGYYRITLPDTLYVDFETLYPDYPYTFDLSQNAVVQPRNDEPYWINVYYPALDATIHCSYKSVHRNLRELSDDALEFVYRNASFANAIPEREYARSRMRCTARCSYAQARIESDSPINPALALKSYLYTLRSLQ